MASKPFPRIVSVGHASVTVYRHKHPDTASGWIHVVVWYAADAKRRREKFADEGEAMKHARTVAAQLSAGRVEGAELTRGDRDELAAARSIVGSVGKTPLLAALREWAQAYTVTGGNIITAAEAWRARNSKGQKKATVSEIVDGYIAAKAKAGKLVSTYHGPTFERIKKDLGGQIISTVTASQLDAWLANWPHPVTRNTYRRRLVGVWRWAQRNHFLNREVATEAEQTESAHEPAPVIGIIDVATWRRLLAYFAEHHAELLPALVVSGFCGLRRAEVHEQVWEDINLERKHLRVSRAKRGTPARRLVPLSDAAVAWLLTCPDRKGHLCPAVEYKGKRKPSLAIDGIRRIAAKAEMPLPENAMRHSYISHAVAATGDIPRVSLDAGNSPKEINRHYRELVAEADGKAWFESAPGVAAEVVEFPKGKAVANA